MRGGGGLVTMVIATDSNSCIHEYCMRVWDLKTRAELEDKGSCHKTRAELEDKGSYYKPVTPIYFPSPV